MSHWSSDVCSSDLAVHTRDVNSFEDMVAKAKRMALRHHMAEAGDRVIIIAGVPFKTPGSPNEIGRASCRERVCQYVKISVVAGTLQKKNEKHNVTYYSYT